MSFDLWLAFLAASTILLIIPGPTVLLVLSYALAEGRKVAVAAAAGVALGDLIAMTVSLAGLGALLATSASAFTILKWLGAAYLVYLGVRLWRTPPTGLARATEQSQGILRHACLVTALNPKSIAFFIAFVPQFIQPERALMPQYAALISSFVVLAGLNALLYALMADRLRRFVQGETHLRWLHRAGAAMLVSMGLAATLVKRA